MQTKLELRKQMRAVLQALSPCARAEASELIITQLLPHLRDHKTIATFAPLPTEPETHHLHHFCSDKKLVYPLVTGDGAMTFHKVDSPESLVKGSYNIPEPDPTIHNVVSPDQIDLILVPAFAFTPQGHRLGKGGGFYDRFLAANPHMKKIGIVFKEQRLPMLPTEAHDQSVDLLITS